MKSGRLDLVMWDAKPLPDTLRVLVGISTTPGSTDSYRCPEVLLRATLDIANDGSLTRTSRLAYPCTGTLPRPSDLPDSVTRVETGHATFSYSNVVLTFDGGTPLTMLPSAEHAQVRAPDLVVDQVASGVNLATVQSLPQARVYRHE